VNAVIRQSPAERASTPVDVYLQPGQYFVGDARYQLRTLLGSCVSITLWHPGLRVGAMSHFLLASRARGPHQALDGRYGEEVLELMLSALARRGVRPEQCQAKIFGGGNMFPDRASGPATIDIGRRNGEAARALLRARGIPVYAEHLFGAGHRQMVFHIGTGEVWVRQVQPACGGSRR